MTSPLVHGKQVEGRTKIVSRGWKREGAGLPPIDPKMVKVPVGYKIPRWLVDWLRSQDVPAAQLIEDALRRRHKLKPPADGEA